VGDLKSRKSKILIFISSFFLLFKILKKAKNDNINSQFLKYVSIN